MTTMRRAANAPPPVDLVLIFGELHAALVQQRQFRLEQLRELAEAAARSPSAVIDVHDEIGEILRTSATTALTEVEAALDRLRAGTYGRWSGARRASPTSAWRSSRCRATACAASATSTCDSTSAEFRGRSLLAAR